jgi:3-oxoacyl-[acyl-carrier protein] reductase
VDFRIAGKKALVTGGSRGLGRAIAEALSTEGARVAICARDAAVVAKTARELRIAGYSCDISKRPEIDRLLGLVTDDFGHIDILVLNTGGPPQSSFGSTRDDMWLAAFDSLWLSSVRLIRGCLPGMCANKWGRIILVTSISAKEPLEMLTISNAMRPGLHGLVNSLSREIAGMGVTINALMPGYTLTERLKDVGFGAEHLAQIPAGRAGSPEDLGAVAAFLASDQAGYITGQAIACDGGYLRSI